jgi:hypothetical protein
MGIIGKGQKTDDQRFSQVHQVVEAVAQSQSIRLIASTPPSRSASRKAAIQKLTTDLAALRQQLKHGRQFQPATTGGGGATRSWLITDIHNESREHGKQYPPAV